MADRVRALEARLEDIRIELNGDASLSRRNEPTPPSLPDRLGQIVYGQ